ncbi:unnamed protein product [Effrenium voratum]|nr:unnamed protein product [Effrenium voratum]
MSGIRSFLCSLSLAGAVAVLHNSDRILRREGCKPACWPECPQAARTGVPCLPSAEKWPYKTHDSWNSELGERVVHAAIPSNATSEDACQGFKQFGDAAWCLAAFAGEEGVVGLSFGIEQRDLWSETMSNFFHMKTKLYDCFQDPSSSPPLAMKAPNAQGPCTDVKGHCYETAYEAFRTCLGPSTTTVEDRAYVALPTLLEHKAPLSVHLKMDVEGSEWSVLEDLLSHPGSAPSTWRSTSASPRPRSRSRPRRRRLRSGRREGGSRGRWRSSSAWRGPSRWWGATWRPTRRAGGLGRTARSKTAPSRRSTREGDSR